MGSATCCSNKEIKNQNERNLGSIEKKRSAKQSSTKYANVQTKSLSPARPQRNVEKSSSPLRKSPPKKQLDSHVSKFDKNKDLGYTPHPEDDVN